MKRFTEMTDEEKMAIGLKIIKRILHNYNGKMRDAEIPRAFPEYSYALVSRILQFMESRGWSYAYTDSWNSYYIVR